MHAAGAPYVLAAVVSFAVAVVNNFAGNRIWTFDARDGALAPQGARFTAVSLVGLGANLGVLHLLVRAGLEPVVAQAAAIALVTPVSFLGNKLWSFRDAAAPPTPALPPERLVRCAVERPCAVVCLPVYNERDNLEPMLHALRAVLGPRDVVLVIDDSSPDGTGALADELAERLGFVDVLHRPAKQGLGRAYLAGFRTALDRGAELVLELDADFSHDPADVPRLIAAASGADLVIGSRYVDGGSAEGLGALRGLVSRAGCLYARLGLGLRVRDLTGGFKCYRRRVLEAIRLERISSSGYAFQIETTFRAARAGFTVAELPIAFRERARGRSKMGLGIVGEALWRVPALRLAALASAVRASGRLAVYARIAVWWGFSRALVLGATLAVQLAHWPRPGWYPDAAREPFALLRAWDGRWYRIVASHGYLVVPGHQSDTAFFPLYPILLRGLHQLGLPFTYAGALVSNAAFLVALVAVYELGTTWLAREDAERMAVYVALFPFGFVFSMLYPEGIVLAAMALAGVLAWRSRWRGAAVAAAVAALGRPDAVFLALPIGALALERWRGLEARERSRALAAALSAPAAVAGLAAYAWRTVGDPVAFSHAQIEWGRRFSVLGVGRAWQELAHAPQLHREWLFRDAAFVAVYLACLLLARRAGVPWAWIAAAGLMVLLPLESGSVTSEARFGLLAIPVYAGLARLGRRPAVDLLLRCACPVLLAGASATILLHWP